MNVNLGLAFFNEVKENTAIEFLENGNEQTRNQKTL